MSQRYLFTSESVSEGHPDKVCDQVSDSVLDAALAADRSARVACETLVTTNLCIVAGEITCKEPLDYEKIARETIRRIGYCKDEYLFNADSCEVQVRVHEQSGDISMGVTPSDAREQGAGDQGLMFGFACNETEELMPAPISYSHQLMAELARQRHAGEISWIRPDSKSQVTGIYEGFELKGISAVVISTQHDPEVTQDEIREAMIDGLIRKVIPANLLSNETKFYINPTGRFEIGGPHGDCGLTGRKIIVDTYGGMGRHGGGAFSGKDPSKVDRSAAYAARWAAKNVVAAGLADRCEVQLAYAIGVAQPLSIHVDTQGTGKVADEMISSAIKKVFDFRPGSIIKELDLLRPIYSSTAAYGHFGRKGDEFTWESTARADELRSVAGDLATIQV